MVGGKALKWQSFWAGFVALAVSYNVLLKMYNLGSKNTQKVLYNIGIYIATEYGFRNICLEKEIDIFPN